MAIPGAFTPLQKWIPAGKALCFFEVADDQLQRLADAARNAGGNPCFIAPFSEPRRGAQLSDYTWNHTTLWALEAGPVAHLPAVRVLGDRGAEPVPGPEVALRSRLPAAHRVRALGRRDHARSDSGGPLHR
jgi:hypothetical protein